MVKPCCVVYDLGDGYRITAEGSSFADGYCPRIKKSLQKIDKGEDSARHIQCQHDLGIRNCSGSKSKIVTGNGAI